MSASPPAPITLRSARYSELPTISHILARAFWDDNLFGDLIHPYRNKYPNGFDLYWLRRARVSYWESRTRWLVAVKRDANGKEIIVATAQWVRLGKGGKDLDRRWFDPRNLLEPLFSVLMRVHALLYPNRACDPPKEDIIERSYPYFEGIWSGDRAESWYLSFLGVDPDYQGKRIGQKLVQWGLDRAEEEGICASVISARGKDDFYRKCGFDLQHGSASTMGEGNPLKDVEGGNMFWRMPEHDEKV